MKIISFTKGVFRHYPKVLRLSDWNHWTITWQGVGVQARGVVLGDLLRGVARLVRRCRLEKARSFVHFKRQTHQRDQLVIARSQKSDSNRTFDKKSQKTTSHCFDTVQWAIFKITLGFHSQHYRQVSRISSFLKFPSFKGSQFEYFSIFWKFTYGGHTGA